MVYINEQEEENDDKKGTILHGIGTIQRIER